jgi:hypothetical protein
MNPIFLNPASEVGIIAPEPMMEEPDKAGFMYCVLYNTLDMIPENGKKL